MNRVRCLEGLLSVVFIRNSEWKSGLNEFDKSVIEEQGVKVTYET